jgi:hypothetical protein
MINKNVQNLEFILNVKNGNSYMYMYNNTSLHFSVRGFPKEFIEKTNQKQILFEFQILNIFINHVVLLQMITL